MEIDGFLHRNSSTDMDPALALEQLILKKNKPIIEAAARGDSAIQNFYNGSKIFLTGGSGFIGKLIIEKIFRTCAVNTVYVLVRTKKKLTPKDRLSEILKDPVFTNLHEEKPDFVTRLIPIEGDIRELNLGVSDDDWNIIIEEVDIIFHIAATVKFDMGLKEAVLSNVRGTREALKLGKACRKLRAYVHVSTAYTNATRSNNGCVIPERFQESPAPPEALIQLAEALDDARLDGLTECYKQEWPNTYTLSKAIAEEIVRTMSGDMPICILRPSIVVCTYCEPTPGWLDKSCVYGPTGLILGIELGLIHSMIVDKKIGLNLVPADMVTNAIIASAWETARKQRAMKEPKIYTISNTRNQTTWDDAINVLRYTAPNFSTPKVLWYRFDIETDNKLLFLLLTWVLHFIPAYIIDGVLSLFAKPRRFVKLYEKVYKMSDLFSFFMNHDWLFSDDNVQKLYSEMSDTDKTLFNFNISSISTKELILIWVIGIRKYIIKDGLKDTEYAKKKIFWLQILHYVTMVLYVLCFWKIVSLLFWSTTAVFNHLITIITNCSTYKNI